MKEKSYSSIRDGVVPAVCSLDCPDQCGLLLHKKDGRVIKIEGDPAHPVTQGAICNKVRNMAERLYDPKRLTTPLKRIGTKGEGRFEPITWEEAVQEITSRWKRLQEDYGPESIMPYSFYGNMGLIGTEGLDRRFFHRMGSTALEYTICQAAGGVGYTYTMGSSIGIDPEDTIHSKLIIMWGINTVSTNMHQVVLAEQARKAGAQIVVIDVHRNQTGRWADWFIPIKPGTDAALALGMMHILFAEGMTDEAFLQEYTVGSEELREHVKAYDPHKVSVITGIPVEDIYKLARLYGQTTPSFIRIGNGIQHHDNGGMCIRTISCLPALTGQWLKRGGGAIKSNSGHLLHNVQGLQRPDLLTGTPRKVNMNQLGQALMELEPPIRSLYVYNSNPAVVAPNAALVREGLQREDLFTVVHDLFLTETARYADLVLPATSSFENTDLYTSYWHHYVQLQEPVLERYGESKSNTEVFRLLAAAMGFEEPSLQDSDEELVRQALDFPHNPVLDSITYDSLRDVHFLKGKVSPPLSTKLRTPSGKIELYSTQMERLGLPPLPVYTPLVEEGSSYPFWFIPAPNHHFLNSTFSNNEKHVKLEKTPKLHIHRADAGKLGLQSGDQVKVWNDQGACVLTAVVGEDVLPGVVVSQGLWADTPAGDATALVNALVPDRLADLGGGAVFFSGRVQVESLHK